MRIGIIGAGALGGMFAALLDAAGHEVEVTARGEHLAAIRERGLRLTGGYGDHLARVAAADALTTRPELALLAVKAQDAPAAAAQNAAFLDGVPLVVVQNGLSGPQAVEAVLAGTPTIGAASMIAASFLEPGLVTVTAPALTVLSPSRATLAQTHRAADVLAGVVETRVDPDLVGVQWAKLVVNQLNAGPALTGLPAQDAVASLPLVTALAAAMRETARVARAQGVALASPPLPAALLPALTRLPLPIAARLIRRAVRAGMGDVPNPGSTLQSIRRGRVTEIDHLSGAVVERGRVVGVPTPVNERIVAIVHEVERTGAFLSPEDAARRLHG